MIQDLTSVIENAAGGLCHNLFQGHGLILGAGDEFVEVVHIGLEVLAVVEGQGLSGNDGLERVDGIREVDQVEHGMAILYYAVSKTSKDTINLCQNGMITSEYGDSASGGIPCASGGVRNKGKGIEMTKGGGLGVAPSRPLGGSA